MSRHEIGVDLIDIDRIVTTLGRFPTASGSACSPIMKPVTAELPSGSRWAAKEAISKVLGLGVRGLAGARSRSCRISRARGGRLHARRGSARRWGSRT
jgi:phosphopantetheinyl transferase (holo-ACP synthase)